VTRRSKPRGQQTARSFSAYRAMVLTLIFGYLVQSEQMHTVLQMNKTVIAGD